MVCPALGLGLHGCDRVERPHETEEEVREHVKEHWEVDPDTGDDLEE